MMGLRRLAIGVIFIFALSGTAFASMEHQRDTWYIGFGLGTGLSESYTVNGQSMDFGDWRFNLRASNTEPLLRLNVESRGDQGLMERRRDEILNLIS